MKGYDRSEEHVLIILDQEAVLGRWSFSSNVSINAGSASLSTAM